MMSPLARLYRITLPVGANAEDFVSFMAKEVFTVVDTGPSRAVNVSAQRLFHNAHAKKEYLWLVEYEYNLGQSPEVSGLKKLQAYGADVGMSSYVELLSWPDRSDGADH